VKRIAAIGFVALTVAIAPATRAQYTTNFQTNIISGVTSNWSGDYRVGGEMISGDVLLIISNGILFNASGYVGYGLPLRQGLPNVAVVDGSGSVWNNNSNLWVGYEGPPHSQLIITNGGQVIDNNGTIGGGLGAGGSVLVTGTGSVWSNRSSIFLGRFDSTGSNALMVADGGQVFDNAGTINGGTVVVTDAGSVWNITSNLVVIGSAPAAKDLGRVPVGNGLTIANGGEVVSRSGIIGTVFMGGNVLVTGTGSVWRNSGTVSINSGPASRSSLVISNYAKVISASSSSVCGTEGGESNSVRVVDGGVWDAGPGLLVGDEYGFSPNNSLTVAGGTGLGSYLFVGCNNLIELDSGSIFVTNRTKTAVFDIAGTFILNGGMLKADMLVMTDPCAQFIRTGGTLIYGTAVLTSNLDADGDGIPNGYEQSHGLDPLNAADADADNDGDGMSNLQEALAGTDPTNSASAFRITSVVRTDNDVLVMWATAGGRTNVVQVAPNLGGSYSNISPNIVVSGSGDATTNYLDAGGATNSASRFYRIGLVP
jgi:T5SS/PEP-CTERM-associated repeat protein